MSFGTQGRRVRDPALPFALRVMAMRSAIELYSPIGYHATYSYLAEVAGPHRRDEAALLRAIDVMTASRELWLAELRAYTRVRKAEKRAGRRTPREFPPGLDHWYGDPRRGALHALRHWHRQPLAAMTSDDPDAAEVVRLIAAVLIAQGDLEDRERGRLSRLTTRLQARTRDGGYGDWRSWHLLFVTRVTARAAEESVGPARQQ